MASDKIYVPKSAARARQTQYGEVLNLSFDVDALVNFAQAHRNAKGRLNLTLIKRRELGTYGETHSVTLDTYEPQKREPVTPADAPVIPDEDIPFAVLLPLVLFGAGLL